MSVPVSLDRLREEISGFESEPYLLTVSDDERPHCVSAVIAWQGNAIVIGAGNRTAANASSRPSVSLLWPPNEPGGYSLIVDGTVTSASGAGAGGNVVVVEPTGAVLHRSAAGGGADCAPVLGT